MTPPRSPPPLLGSAVVLLFFLSGASGLLYEVVWTRYLTLLLGHTARGNAVVLATFMGGLALGYHFAGPLADRLARRADAASRLLGLYALCEAGIGLYGLLFPPLMALSSSLYLGVGARLGPDSPWLLPLSLAIAVAVLLPPTVLMGATLPALVTWAADRPGAAGGQVARFYSANSAGAVVGAVLAGFVLIERLGQRRTVELAAALSLLLALAAWLLARSAARSALREPVPETHDPGIAPPPADRADPVDHTYPADPADPVPRWLPALVALGSGFAALVLEVAWIRLFAVIFGSSTQSFTAIVAAFVAGVSLGAAGARRLLAPGPRGVPRVSPLLLLCFAASLSALLVLAAEPAYSRLPWLLGRLRVAYGATHSFWRFQGAKFYLSFLVMVVPAAVSGLLLPLAVSMKAREPRHTGREVGGVLAWNAVGAVAGAALGGTVLVPRLSLPGTLHLAVAVLLGLAVVAALCVPGPWSKRAALALGPMLLVVPLALLGSRWDARLLSTGEFRRNTDSPDWARWRAEQSTPELLMHEDGQVATVDVLALPDGRRYLKVNAKTDASSWGDVLTAAASPAVGALLSDGVKGGSERAGRGLVIGFGGGITANTLLKFGLEVDLVEIEPAVLHAAPWFATLNDDCLADPHLHTHIADARAFLAMPPRGGDAAYDVIVNEPSNPWVAGVASLFTREFFQAARARLAPGGTFVQWFHLYDMDDDTVRLVLRTVGDSFRFVTVWSFENDIAVVGRTTPMGSGMDAIATRFARPAVRQLLNRVGVYDLAALLSTQLASEASFPSLGGSGPLHEDDLPVLEHHAPRAQFDRSYAFLLAARDERRDFGDLSSLLLGGWARARGGLSLDEAIDITLLQASEPRTPDEFRFRWLDRVLAECREPVTLGRLVLSMETARRPAETDRALAALTLLEPEAPRTALLRAQVRVRRLGAAAATDAEVAQLLRLCDRGEPGPLLDACRRLAKIVQAPSATGP